MPGNNNISLPPEKAQLLLFGKIHEYSGKESSYIVKFYENFYDFNSLKNSFVFIEINNILIPFYIIDVSKYSKNKLIINFKDISIPSRNKLLEGKKIYIRKAISSEIQETEFHKYLNYSVYHKDKCIGKIVDVLSFSLNTILEVETQEKKILIPVHKNLIRQVDTQKKIIKIIIAEGLLD